VINEPISAQLQVAQAADQAQTNYSAYRKGDLPLPGMANDESVSAKLQGCSIGYNEFDFFLEN
jgi:hypothetical protein